MREGLKIMETMTEEIFTPEAESVLTPEVVQFVKTETFQISRELQTLDVKTAADDKQAVTLGLANKSAIKRIEAFRLAIVKPLNDHVKNINGVFEKIMVPFENNDRVIKQKRDVYLREQERLRAEEQRRIDEQYRKEQAALDEARRKEQEKLNKKAEKKGVEAPNLPPATVLPPPPKVEVKQTVQTDIGRSTVRKIMKFEVIDPNLVPREYLMPDEKKIGAAVRAKLATSIPGVKIWEELNQSY